MKVGHYQCACKAGDFEANAAKVIKGLEFAEREGVSIMTFPESFLTGYYSDESRARQNSLRVDGDEIARLLERTKGFGATFMVGFNETRGGDIRNTVLVAERGELLGTYSKAFPCYEYFTPGREFPLFERDGVTFGVIICADGGYIDPVRILALKGAQIVFAPHYNYIGPGQAIDHFQKVRADHVARAVENGVWFMRCNNVVFGRDRGLDREGIGYGDSYLLDPAGEFVVKAQRNKECFISADIDVHADRDLQLKTVKSARTLLPLVQRALDDRPV